MCFIRGKLSGQTKATQCIKNCKKFSTLRNKQIKAPESAAEHNVQLQKPQSVKHTQRGLSYAQATSDNSNQDNYVNNSDSNNHGRQTNDLLKN